MLEKAKLKVIEISKKAQEIGLCKHKSGNFSIRDKDTGYLIITPSGVDRRELTPDIMCVLKLDGTIIEIGQGYKPSSETKMHMEIYKARKDVFAIAHTHSKFATAFAVLNKEIPAIIYEVAGLGLKDAKIPVAPYAKPGTLDLAKSVVAPLKNSDIFLMERHGLAAVGKDLDDAFLKAQYAEELAEIYYYTLMIGGGKEPIKFTPEELGY